MISQTDPWPHVPLEDVCVPGGLVRGPFGGSLKKSDFVSAGFQVYEQRHAISGSVTGARYYVTAKKFWDMKRFSVRPGDLIVSCSGTIGRIFQIPEDAPDGIINQALLKITLDDRVIDPRYFLSYFQWDDFQDRILDSTQGGAMQNLVGMPIFKKTPIALPPMQEQMRLAEALEDSNNEIATLERLIAKKHAIKQGMMQQLLTGETQLPGFSGPVFLERKRILSQPSCIDNNMAAMTLDPAKADVRFVHYETLKNGYLPVLPP